MVEEVKVKTVAELEQELMSAIDKKDYPAVRKLSAELDKATKGAEKAEQAAKEAALAALADKVKSIINKAVTKIVDSGEIDDADGIWFAWDFGEAAEATGATCKLFKKAAKTSTGTGGGGKKFSTSTDTLMEQFGDETIPEDKKPVLSYKVNGEVKTASGMSYKEAYKLSTDGNFRYKIREHLLKLAGIA
jgi:hypothetical protein